MPHHSLEIHSIEPHVLNYETLSSDLSFHDWNHIVGVKMHNLGIAQKLGDITLQKSDQTDIDALHRAFPDHHKAYVHDRNSEYVSVDLNN